MVRKQSVNDRELHAHYTIMNRRASSIEIGACQCNLVVLETSVGIKANYRRILWAHATCKYSNSNPVGIWTYRWINRSSVDAGDHHKRRAHASHLRESTSSEIQHGSGKLIKKYRKNWRREESKEYGNPWDKSCHTIRSFLHISAFIYYVGPTILTLIIDRLFYTKKHSWQDIHSELPYSIEVAIE